MSVYFDDYGYRVSIGKALSDVRAQKDMPVPNIARYCNTTPRSIYRFFAGENQFNWMSRLIQVCTVLEINPKTYLCSYMDEFVMKH